MKLHVGSSAAACGIMTHVSCIHDYCMWDYKTAGGIHDAACAITRGTCAKMKLNVQSCMCRSWSCMWDHDAACAPPLIYHDDCMWDHECALHCRDHDAAWGITWCCCMCVSWSWSWSCMWYQVHVGSWSCMWDHEAASWCCVCDHDAACGIMKLKLHVGSWRCMWDHDAACGIMKLHVVSWSCMWDHMMLHVWDHEAACGIMMLRACAAWSWCCMCVCCRWDHEAACGIMILHVGSNHSDCCRVPTWVRSHWRSNLRNIISWKQHIFKHFLFYTLMTIGLFIFFNTSNVDVDDINWMAYSPGLLHWKSYYS